MAINVKEDGQILAGDTVCGYVVALWLEWVGVVLIAERYVDGDLEPLPAVGGQGDVEDGPPSAHHIEVD